ncbi:MAG: epoxyqueuosine reductase QueH [Deltaproteobacteria bacterium]|nr:epoxyqueuosine reductase QueH [Deltaproteobacteria bacterium]
MKKILLHICCAPCAIYPLKVLRGEGFEVMGFFYRRNIHPYQECLRRENALKAYAEQEGITVIYQDGYDMEGFLQNVVFREESRCSFCYHDRLKATAVIARRGKFDAFSSTLLQSKFQQHDLIKAMGEDLGKSYGVPFFYRDFRQGWKEGIQASRRLNLYRQQYCGCIYSEKERFYGEDRL